MEYIQLELFERRDNELDAVWRAVEEQKQSMNKLRKRLFAEIKDLEEEIINLRAENQRLSAYEEVKPLEYVSF